MMRALSQVTAGIAAHPILARRAWMRQMLKSAIVGVSNTLLDFFVYLLLTRFAGMYYLAANILSFALAVTSSFFLNKRWTFRNRSRYSHVQYGKFVIISAGGLFINEGVLYTLVEHYGIPDIVGKTAGIVLVFFWNFLLYKYWVFRTVGEPLPEAKP